MKNNIFEDFAKVSTNIASSVIESVKTLQTEVQSKTQGFAKSVDLITRDEFEAVKSLSSKIKMENESIFKEISEMKKQMQNFATSFDILKQQISNVVNSGAVASGSGAAAINQSVLEEIKAVGSQIDDKINRFENLISEQQSQIAEMQIKLAEKSKSDKKASSQNSLFENA
jgi:BMFP domain-containing protein YqiC